MDIERIDTIQPPPPEINEVQRIPEEIKPPEETIEDGEDSDKTVDLFA